MGIDKTLHDSSKKHDSSLSLNSDTTIVPEWDWLRDFALAVRTADALTYRMSFPAEFSVLEDETLDSEIAYQPMVGFFFSHIEQQLEPS